MLHRRRWRHYSGPLSREYCVQTIFSPLRPATSTCTKFFPSPKSLQGLLLGLNLLQSLAQTSTLLTSPSPPSSSRRLLIRRQPRINHPLTNRLSGCLSRK